MSRRKINYMTAFEVGDDYETKGVMAHDTVCSALHKPSGAKVMVRKLTSFDHPQTWQRALREVRLLRHFRHENMISILEIRSSNSCKEIQDVYLIQGLMETNLGDMMTARRLSDYDCQYLVYQTLLALQALHSADILHRNLQPSNLLVNGKLDLKVRGFGVACSAANMKTHQGSVTGSVGKQWYRAPEMMLTPNKYTKAVDLWSVGCIMAEILRARPLLPGETYFGQLDLIFDLLGTPTGEDNDAIGSNPASAYILALPTKAKPRWKNILPEASDYALDLIGQLLVFNPGKRFIVRETLRHRYFKQYFDLQGEPAANAVPEDFLEFEKIADELSIEETKSEVSH